MGSSQLALTIHEENAEQLTIYQAFSNLNSMLRAKSLNTGIAISITYAYSTTYERLFKNKINDKKIYLLHEYYI
jgi:hypothetical protein